MIMAMPCSTSTGSKPVMTPGMPYFSARNRYGSAPMMVLTWPGRMSASSLSFGSLMMASSAPGMFLWAPNTVKFSRPAAAARLMAMATSGVVVSKPTPTNTISRSGFCWASASASSGEYTICTLRPAACSFRRLDVEPGTRVMSPNVAMVTLSVRASAMTVSMS